MWCLYKCLRILCEGNFLMLCLYSFVLIGQDWSCVILSWQTVYMECSMETIAEKSQNLCHIEPCCPGSSMHLHAKLYLGRCRVFFFSLYLLLTMGCFGLTLPFQWIPVHSHVVKAYCFLLPAESAAIEIVTKFALIRRFFF